MNRSVLLIGPGALGAWTAAHLADAGHDVVVACRSQETVDHIASHGVVAEDVRGRPTVARVPAITRPRELDGDVDLVIHATKCAAAVPAWKTWRPAVPKDAPLVSLHNGLMGDVLAPLSDGRLVSCTVAFPATRTGTARSQRTGPGGFLLGAWPPRPRPDAAETLARDVLAAAAPTEIVEDIQGVQWTKLLINSCITSLGALTGTTMGELLRDARARDAFLDLVTEGHQVGLAAGVRFASVDGFRPAMVADRRIGQGRLLRKALLRLMAVRYRRHRSSSLQSLEKGEPTEVDHLNGVIAAHGDDHGIPTPVHDALIAAVHRIEAGKMPPSMQNLDRLRT